MKFRLVGKLTPGHLGREHSGTCSGKNCVLLLAETFNIFLDYQGKDEEGKDTFLTSRLSYKMVDKKLEPIEVDPEALSYNEVGPNTMAREIMFLGTAQRIFEALDRKPTLPKSPLRKHMILKLEDK